jgi:Putative MetA-pathway of phenol degradation
MVATAIVLVLASAMTAAPAGSDKAPAGGTTASVVQGARELGEMVTDRPDFTESSDVVGRGVAQFESGLSLEGGGAGAAATRGFSAPQALLRVGLSSRVELRLGGEGFLSEREGIGSATVRTSGGSDFEAGLKIRLAGQDRAGLDLAIIPMVSLPVGSAAFTSGGTDPTVKFTWGRALPRGFDLSGNVNVGALTEGDRRFRQTATSASIAHDLGHGWGGYWELYGFSALEAAGAPAWTFNTGVTYGLGPNRQVDVSVGRGLTSAAPDWFVSAGFAVRGAWRR